MQAQYSTSGKINVSPLTVFPGFIRNSSVFIADNLSNYGDFFKIGAPGINIYAVANPSVLEHILMRNESNYVKSKYYWQQLKAIIGDALGTLEGDEWILLKKLHTKALTINKAVSYLDLVSENINYYVEEWRKLDDPVDIITMLSELNVSILLQTLFGAELKHQCSQIAHLIGKGQEHLLWRSKFPWRPLIAKVSGRDSKYDLSLRYFEELADTLIKNRIADNSDIERLIDILIANSEFKHPADFIRELRSELIVYLGAGTETTAVGLGWTFYLLAQNPDILNKLKNEIDLVVKVDQPGPQHLSQLKYAEYVIKEGLRLYSPSHAIVRDALDDDCINGVPIKKGSSFFVSSYALHRNPEYWSEPDSFQPDRFNSEPQKNCYIPFGAGRHHCIGRYLASPMLILTLCAIVRNFDIELIQKKVIIPMSGSTLKPDHPILIKLNPRK